MRKRDRDSQTFELFCIKTNGWIRLCVELMDAKRNNNNNNNGSTCFFTNLQTIPCVEYQVRYIVNVYFDDQKINPTSHIVLNTFPGYLFE